MSDEIDTHYNFKRISVGNWNRVDETFAYVMAGLSLEWYVAGALQPQLLASVPEEVRALFEVARGSMIYGVFFYPLLTLGSEQCHRVAEAAVAAKCKAVMPVGAGKKFTSFKENVEKLIAAGLVVHNVDRWRLVVKLRNHASHPASQSIASPGMALTTLMDTVECINGLFP